MASPTLFNQQGQYRQRYGEATVLQAQGPNSNLALATENRRQQAQKYSNPEELITSWDADYFPLKNDIKELRANLAKKVARKEIDPDQAMVLLNRGTNEVLELGKLTKSQEKEWGEVAKIYASDGDGKYNTNQGYLFLDIYKNPEKYLNQPGLGPELQKQLDSVGGNHILWRAKYGNNYLKPQITYDHNKMVESSFGDINEIKTSRIDEIRNFANMRGVEITDETTFNDDAIIFKGRSIRDMALTGEHFKEQQYYKTAYNYITNNVKFDAEGNLSLTQGGRQLLQTMTELFQYDPETGTIMTENGRQELGPREMQDYLYDAYNVLEGRKLQQQEQKKKVNLRNSVTNNISVSGRDPKAKVGYFVTQTESFNDFKKNDVPKILSKYPTEEDRNSDAYVNDVMDALGKKWGVRQQSEGNYIGFRVNAKDTIQSKNRIIDTNNLSILGPEGNRIPITNIEGTLQGLEPAGTEITVGIFDPRTGQYMQVTKDMIKSGQVNVENLVPMVRQTYKIPAGKTEKKRDKAGKQIEVPVGETETMAAIRKAMKDNNGNRLVQFIPLDEKGAAQALDSSFETKEEYGSVRKEGYGEQTGETGTPDAQSTVDEIYGE